MFPGYKVSTTMHFRREHRTYATPYQLRSHYVQRFARIAYFGLDRRRRTAPCPRAQVATSSIQRSVRRAWSSSISR